MLASARWSQFRGQSQYVALALAELGHDVLYVDPPVSPFSVVRNRARAPDLFGAALERPAPNVLVWRPRVMPGQNAWLGQRVNARLTERGIARHLGPPDVTLAYSLESRAVLERLGGVRTYVCYDSFENVQGVATERLRQRQASLLSRVDRVVVTSRPLQQQLAARGASPVYVPHGCDPLFLVERSATTPPELVDRQRPFGGYLGTLNYRLDADLLHAALKGLGAGSLVLIGAAVRATGPGLDERSRALLADERVLAIGHREGDELAQLLAALDVGLVPYTLTEFNRMSYPLKIPQYLAAGLSVVSTTNGATDELKAHVLVADDAASFAAQVERAVDTSSEELAASRRAAVAARPWTVVAQEILDAC
jgi:glycosyltransferase involved in cell wall biosynthesis